MPRKRTESEDPTGNAFDFDSIGAGDFASRYIPPDESSPDWQLPDNARIVGDLKRCGSDINLYLQAIDSELSSQARQVLLASILFQVSQDQTAQDDFEKVRSAGESARLLLAEEKIFRLAGAGDTTALKFVLEKRLAGKFGKQTSEETSGLVEELKKFSAQLRNKNG